MNQIQKIAYDLYQKCIFLKKKQGELALEFGMTLKEIRDKKLYQHMGEGGFDNFYQFLASPEISLNPNTALMYIRVYEFYIEKLKIPKEKLTEIPVNRLNQLKSGLENKSKDEIEEWIEKARVLGRKDFEKEMEEARMKKEDDIKIKICKKCGKKQIYYKVNSLCYCDGGVGIYAIPEEI
jgi:hypothetical protein